MQNILEVLKKRRIRRIGVFEPHADDLMCIISLISRLTTLDVDVFVYLLFAGYRAPAFKAEEYRAMTESQLTDIRVDEDVKCCDFVGAHQRFIDSSGYYRIEQDYLPMDSDIEDCGDEMTRDKIQALFMYKAKA